MLTKYVLRCLCIIVFLLSCSCSGVKSREEIIEEAQRYNGTDNGAAYEYQNALGEWLTPEIEYRYAENTDNSDGIKNLFVNNYMIQNDRLYFQVSKPSDNSIGDKLWSYINIKTGEKHYLCPDPLCVHTRDSTCQYLELADLIINPNSENILYSTKNASSYLEQKYIAYLYEIDLSNNRISEKYKSDIIEPDAQSDYFNLLFISDNKLYFTDRYNLKETNDYGEIVHTEKTYLMVYDLTSGESEVISGNFNPENDCIYEDDNHIFFINQYEKRFYMTDMNFENENTIFTFDKDYQVCGIFYDENYKEFYLLVGNDSLYDSMDADNANGKLYRIDENFQCSEIPMPSDQIIEFQLTKDYIYYTVYDPIYYGVTPLGTSAIDEDGNKIYRVQRDNTSKEELAFDGRGELFFNGGFVAVGNYLYIDYYSLRQSGGMAWWRRGGSTARINMNENTIKWINLD